MILCGALERDRDGVWSANLIGPLIRIYIENGVRAKQT